MVVFGGAGGQHACAVARLLGVRTLVFHPLAGVLSAYGMGAARVGWHGEADAGQVACATKRSLRSRTASSRSRRVAGPRWPTTRPGPSSWPCAASICATRARTPPQTLALADAV
jgi:hypothetical protein